MVKNGTFFGPKTNGTVFREFPNCSRLFIVALRSTARKGLTSCLSFVMFNCVFVTFPFGILGQVLDLIVSIPDLCHLCYFKS